MLNNAWPSMIWHLYDYYLLPGGGYFGAKKACEPLHIMYSYDDRSIAVVNSLQQAFSGLKAVAKIYDIDLKEKFSKEATLDVGADGVETAMTLPEPDTAGPTYFVKLDLYDSTGKNVSTNFYWLSTKKDVLDWKNTQWWATPTISYADMTGINKLSRVKLKAAASSRRNGANGKTVITVETPTHSLALAVELRLAKAKGGDDVLPALWQDNYFALMPGEKREITVSYRSADAGAHPQVEVRGWNIDSTWVKPSAR
jgi:exo-1,4-beta-D-glucosaminidase